MINRLYIHVPFCASKCGYCAFYSLPSPKAAAIDSYLGKLALDFRSSSHLCGKLDSVFIGGGTPTFLSAESLKKLFSSINSFFDISASAEISIECNPETLTPEKARIIAKSANRVSLGIQSFNPRFRKILGRQGSVSTIRKAISLLTKNGIDNIGCDLIYAIPGQSPEDWQDDLEKAVSLPLKHISAYSLTVEEGTLLAERMSNIEYRISNNEVQNIKMWNLAERFLKQHGFRRYEISNYAKRGSECRHNLEIWYGDKYLGFGPAAASFDGDKRWTNVSDLKKWLSGAEPEIDLIPPEKRAREIFVMGLRTSQGWNKDKLRSKSKAVFKPPINRRVSPFAEKLRRTQKTRHTCTTITISMKDDELSELKAGKLIKENGKRISCTRKGLLLWNEVAESLI